MLFPLQFYVLHVKVRMSFQMKNQCALINYSVSYALGNSRYYLLLDITDFLFDGLRFELDMLLESVSSTAKRAEDLLNNINENKINMGSPALVEDHFTGLYLLLGYQIICDCYVNIFHLFYFWPLLDHLLQF